MIWCYESDDEKSMEIQSKRWASSSRVHLFTRSRKDVCVISVCERWGQADDAFDSCHRCHAVSWTNASRRARLLLWLDVLRSVAAGSMQVLSPKHAADNGDDTNSHTITLPVGVSPQTSAWKLCREPIHLSCQSLNPSREFQSFNFIPPLLVGGFNSTMKNVDHCQVSFPNRAIYIYTYSCIHLFIHLFIYSVIYSFIYLLFIYI